jgi:hypothetical protein
MLSRGGAREGEEAGLPAARRVSISAWSRCSGYQQAGPGREDGVSPMSTRTLLILAAITGVAILTAGAVQILLAR